MKKNDIPAMVELFEKRFNQIKDKWHDSARSHDTGIGKTFEDLMEITENNSPLADFHDWELKSKRSKTASMLTLFTLTPHPPKINNTIRLDYGYGDSEFPDALCFRGTFCSSRTNTVRKTDGTIKIDKENEKVILVLNKKPIAFWTYDRLNAAFQKKAPEGLIFVSADSEKTDKGEKFKFISYELWKIKGLTALIDCIESGDIEIDIRIGVYKTGKKKGKIHDHGTAFRMKMANATKLFDKIKS